MNFIPFAPQIAVIALFFGLVPAPTQAQTVDSPTPRGDYRDGWNCHNCDVLCWDSEIARAVCPGICGKTETAECRRRRTQRQARARSRAASPGEAPSANPTRQPSRPISASLSVDGNQLLPEFMNTRTGQPTQFSISCRVILGIDRDLPEYCSGIRDTVFQNECLVRRRIIDHLTPQNRLSESANWAYFRRLSSECRQLMPNIGIGEIPQPVGQPASSPGGVESAE